MTWAGCCIWPTISSRAERFDQELRGSLAARVPQERDVTLKEVAARRIARVIEGRWPLPRETVDFWNALIGY